METITPENVLSVEHNTWLAHPVTKQLIKNIHKHKDSFVKASTSAAGNTAEPEIGFRLNAYGVRTLDAVEEWITNTDKFITQSNKK
jgi:hypothetical protein